MFKKVYITTDSSVAVFVEVFYSSVRRGYYARACAYNLEHWGRRPCDTTCRSRTVADVYGLLIPHQKRFDINVNFAAERLASIDAEVLATLCGEKVGVQIIGEAHEGSDVFEAFAFWD